MTWGSTSARELDGATICARTGTTTELNLAECFKVNSITYQPVPIQTPAEADQQFLAGACDAYTTDASRWRRRAGPTEPGRLRDPARDHLQGAAGPVVRQGDDQWADIVRWTFNALVAAEEYGVTAANAEEMTSSEDPRSGACSAPRATSA